MQFIQWISTLPEFQKFLLAGIGTLAYVFLIYSLWGPSPTSDTQNTLVSKAATQPTTQNRQQLTAQPSNNNNEPDWNALAKQAFSNGSPIPSGFEITRPGNKTTTLITAYPQPVGKQLVGQFVIHPTGSVLIDRVSALDNRSEDPTVTQVHYHFDEAAETAIKRRLMELLGTDNMISKSLGKELIWENIDGLQVSVYPTHLDVDSKLTYRNN